jgi:uncharacterized RDD family membrane protein YckC
MAIKFACPYCDTVSSVPESFAGKKGKCPSCQKLIEVPDPTGGATPAADEVPADAPTMPPPSRREPEGAADADTKNCRYCGETIRRVAKKCKFCGEFLDDRVKANRRGGRARLPLATPLNRLWAKLIDIGLDMVALLPMFIGIGLMVAADGGGRRRPDETLMIAGLIAMALGGLCYLGLTIYQWYLISTRGATIGKGFLKVKIVQASGRPVGFVDGVLLRNWVVGFIVGMCNSVVPCLGTLFWLVDVLMIFGTDHKTLHDQIATTRVIRDAKRDR